MYVVVWKKISNPLEMMRMYHCYLCLLRRINVKLKFILSPNQSISELTYMDMLRERNKGQQSVEDDENDGQCSESIDETINGIHFEDNEEERMHDFDEDFNEGFS